MAADDRNTDMTLTMVKSLPATGAIVVVPESRSFRAYIERMIGDVHGENAKNMQIVAVQQQGDLEMLRGVPLPVFIDHAWWHMRRGRLGAELEAWQATNNAKYLKP